MSNSGKDLSLKAIERLILDLRSANQNDEVLALMDQVYERYEVSASEISFPLKNESAEIRHEQPGSGARGIASHWPLISPVATAVPLRDRYNFTALKCDRHTWAQDV